MNAIKILIEFLVYLLGAGIFIFCGILTIALLKKFIEISQRPREDK